MGPQAHGYTVVAFHPESKGIVIYIFLKDGSGKGIVLNINHDIVPQVIGKTLAWVSHDKEDKIKVMWHDHTSSTQGIMKEWKNKITKERTKLSYTKLAGA